MKLPTSNKTNKPSPSHQNAYQLINKATTKTLILFLLTLSLSNNTTITTTTTTKTNKHLSLSPSLVQHSIHFPLLLLHSIQTNY